MKQNLLVFIITISVPFYLRLVCLQTIPIGFRIVTWNVENKKPDCNTFEHLAFASSSNGFKADLIVFGFQEANEKLFGSNSFHETLKHCFQNNNYVEIISDYVGSNIIKPIWLYIFVSNTTLQSERVNLLKFGNEPTLKVYQDNIFGNVIGYKGVIASRIQIDKLKNVVFANMHLPAGEEKKAERCKLWTKFLQTYQTNDVKDDYVFVFGDQNWRTLNILSIDNILQAIKKKNYQTILKNDELTQIRQDANAQCLVTFFEAPITFPPTFKYKLNSDEYQTESNNEDRRPSYTDRILVSTLSKDYEILKYSAMNDIKLSDHRPVFADIVLYQQSKNNKTSISNGTVSIKTNTKLPLTIKSLSLILIIVITAVIFILAIYHFIIKHKIRALDTRRTSSIDLVRTRSNSQSTFTNT